MTSIIYEALLRTAKEMAVTYTREELETAKDQALYDAMMSASVGEEEATSRYLERAELCNEALILRDKH